MTYNINNLNVSSLDFDDIVSSLSKFLNEQPDLADIDFQAPGSAASMLLNILATTTAYNGVYGQMSFTNSWPCSANMTESVLSAASLASIVIPYTRSARASATISVGSTAGMQAYSPFNATNTDGSSTFFYNIDDIPSGEGANATLYSGNSVVTYTNYDYTSQSMFIPSSVDPDTIGLYVTPTSGLLTPVKWTRVDKGNQTTTTNNKIFTVINATNGYLVTNNLANAQTITTTYRVSVTAVQSNGSIGNGAVISNNSLGTLRYYESPNGGYDKLNLAQAKAKFNFNANGQQRCVTLSDFENAIACSGLPYTNNTDNITVANSSIPATVKVYVTGLSSNDQVLLLNYLSSRTVAGISVVYSL
jgi:hypothetical protein